MSASILVNIDVPALAPAIEFYEAAVGARVVRLLDDDVAEPTYGSALLCLLSKPPGSAATPTGQARVRDRHWTLSDPFGHGFCLIEFAGDGYE